MVVSAYRAYLDCLLIEKKLKTVDTEFIKKHQCGNSCEFFCRDDLYICTLSGNLHLCNARDCDSYLVARDARVCTLTGLAFNLDFEERQFEDSYNLEEYDWLELHPEEMATNEDADDQEPGDDWPPAAAAAENDDQEEKKEEVDKQIAATQPKRKKRKQCTPLASNVGKYDQYNRLHNEFAEIFDGLLEIEKSTPPAPELRYRVLVICRLIWQTIVNSEFWKACDHKRVYRSDYHALVVFYAMIEGIRLKSHWILPKEAWLSALLPLSSKIRLINNSKIKSFKIKWFTNYGKQFRSALSQITDEEWNEYFRVAKKAGIQL